MIDVPFDQEREREKSWARSRFFNVKSIDLRPSFSRSCASIKFLPRIHISDGKNWYAGRPFLDLFQLTESRNRRSGQNAFDGIYLENRTLTKAHARNCKVFQGVRPISIYVNSSRISCAIGDVNSKRERRKNFYTTFRLLYIGST